MSPARTLQLINGWETVRYELLNSRICEFGLRVEDSPIELYVHRLYRELEEKGLSFLPDVYPTDSWGCPDEVPVIGMPFYLFDKRLARIEEEQTGEVEDGQHIMTLLRHEAGHAVNYAYRLYKAAEWVQMFGTFTKPYRDHFRPHLASPSQTEVRGPSDEDASRRAACLCWRGVVYAGRGNGHPAGGALWPAG